MMTLRLLLMVMVWFQCTQYVMSAGLDLGNSHSCGFWTSSEVKCWGKNDNGQLGDGTTTQRSTAGSVLSVSGVTAISAGDSHTCAVLSDSTVKCWGLNNYGQLGDGTTTNRYTAVPVLSVSGVTAISAGGYHTCAMLSGGTVQCWGYNGYGQLGDGSTTQRSTAGSVLSVSGVTAISAGYIHTCAVLSDSTVKCWGANGAGQLGDGTTTYRYTAVSVLSVSGATAISVGVRNTCAMLSGGAVKCWGYNGYGQLGDGTTSTRYTAVSVLSVSGVTAIASGGYLDGANFLSYTCAMLSAGTMQCWGLNNYGQLGDGTTTNRYTAVPVLSVSDVTAISAGGYHTCAMLSGGTVQCWGLNSYGQLGDGTTTQRLTAVMVGNFYPNPTSQPSGQPSSQPSRQPSSQPSRQPSIQPTSLPSRLPISQPTKRPTSQPTSLPTRQPTAQPTSQPTRWPSSQPTRQPTTQPSSQPTTQPTSPTAQPSRQPTAQPTAQPTVQPSSQPSRRPTSQPTARPSRRPTSQSTTQPTVQPSSQPSRQPTSQPSAQPSRQSTSRPTAQPTAQPSSQPSSCTSVSSSTSPTSQPSSLPSGEPSVQPTIQPVSAPTSMPSRQPSPQPSAQPSAEPTTRPTQLPSAMPSSQPTGQPSLCPSAQPSSQPSAKPSVRPSNQPTDSPSTQPSVTPSCQPSDQPSLQPFSKPTGQPSSHPTTKPSRQPSTQPTEQPLCQPSGQPTSQPTAQPSLLPSGLPSGHPSTPPTAVPSFQPSTEPSMRPSSQPTGQPSSYPSGLPSGQPSTQPTTHPTRQPFYSPSSYPSMQPTSQPSGQPSLHPSAPPSDQPSTQPTLQPTSEPLGQPTAQPSSFPTAQPSFLLSAQPTARPSRQPSSRPSSMPSCQPSSIPSEAPFTCPSVGPSSQPPSRLSLLPTCQPIGTPTGLPSTLPSREPSSQPSTQPSTLPTSQPSMRSAALPTTPPTGLPSLSPSPQPTCHPSAQPLSQPSSQPTNQPTTQPTGQLSRAPTLRLWSARPTVSSMVPTARQTTNSALAVDTAIQDALRSLVTNGTVLNGTVTSMTADGLKLALAVVRPSNTTRNGTTASYAVALPDSSTTVALALPSSLSGGAVAVVVTTVEVDASRFSSFGSSGGNGSSNSSATRPTVPLPSPQLVSSVVTVDFKRLSSNGSLTSSTVPYFETSVSVVRSNSSSSGGGGLSKPTVLAHNCTVGVVETVSVYCVDTAVRLNLTCSGRAAATVRRQCPVSRAVCTVVDLTENRIVSSTFCRTVDLGSSVVCQCGGSGSGVNGSEIASAGRVSVGVFQVYGAGSLTSSVALASALSASDVASRSVMIFASFGCLWGMGLLLLAMSWRRWAGERQRSQLVSCYQTETVPSLWIRLVLPRYYQVAVLIDGSVVIWWKSWMRQRWVQVLMASHPYVRVLRTLGRWWKCNGSARTSVPVGGSDRTGTLVDGSDRTAELADEGHTAMLDVVQALTALTLACGMLALLYDFQYPEDDGFCGAQTTQATCESRKMLLDPFEGQCLWRPPHRSSGSSESSAMDEAAAVVRQIAVGRVVETIPIASTTADERTPCRFNGSNSSTLAFLLSYLITAVFAGVLGLMLDRCQEVLKAKETTVTLRDRRRVGGIIDGNTEANPSDEAASKEKLAVREQLVVREYPETEVHRQRDRHRCSSIGKQSKPLSGRARRRHAVIDVAMVDGGAMVTRTETRLSSVTMVRDPEAASNMAGRDQTSAVSVTAQAVTQAKQLMTSTDYAVTMLRLAVADEVGRLGGPAEHHVCLMGLYRAFPAVVSLRRLWLWQSVVVGVLVVCNGGALYYIVSKAAVRGYGWQVSFLKIALFEWFSEVVLLRSVEITLFDYGLCWLVGEEVEAAVRRLEAVVSKDTAGSPTSTGAFGGGVAVDDDAASVSQEMARQWSGLPESRLVAGLREGRSISHGMVAAARSRVGVGDIDGRNDRRRRWWTRLLSRGSLETWELAVSFGSPLVLAWLVFMYYRFVDGWLTSLSSLDQGLAAMTLVLSVMLIGAAVSMYGWWSGRRRSTVVAVTRAESAVEEVAVKAATDDIVDSESLVWSLSVSQLLSLSLAMEDSGTETGSWHLSDHSDHTVCSGRSSVGSIISLLFYELGAVDGVQEADDGVEDSDDPQDSEYTCSIVVDG